MVIMTEGNPKGEIETDSFSSDSPAFEHVSLSQRGESMSRVATVEEDLQELRACGSDPLPSALFWYPLRLISAVINSKPRQLDGKERVDLITDTTRFALESLETGVLDTDLLEDIGKRLTHHGITSSKVEQTFDQTTLAASTPELSQQSAKRLKEAVSGDVLLVPVGNGGLLSALQTAVYYKKDNPESNMQIYPFLYSRTKNLNLFPHITDYEAVHLKELAKDRTVVVFDEDTVGGVTVGQMITELQRREITTNPILGMTNSDKRSGNKVSRQGVWWETYSPSVLQRGKQKVRELVKPSRVGKK